MSKRRTYYKDYAFTVSSESDNEDIVALPLSTALKRSRQALRQFFELSPFSSDTTSGDTETESEDTNTAMPEETNAPVRSSQQAGTSRPKTPENDTLPCDQCPRVILKPLIYLGHQVAHLELDYSKISCDYCGEQFWNKERLIVHMKLKHKAKLYPRDNEV